MSSNPNEQQKAEEQELRALMDARAIADAAGSVTETIKPFTDNERKRILDFALGELNSKLAVRYGGG